MPNERRSDSFFVSRCSEVVRQVPRTDELPRRVYLRYLNAEWPKVGRFEMDVAKSLSTAADTRPLTKGCRRTMAPMKAAPFQAAALLMSTKPVWQNVSCSTTTKADCDL